MAGGLAALPVGRQSLACILRAEEAGELPLLRLSPPRCVPSLHCVSRGWKASSHLLPGPLLLLAIPDTGSGEKAAAKRRAARIPVGPAAFQPLPRPCARFSAAPGAFLLKSAISARPGRAAKGRAGTALQDHCHPHPALGFPAPLNPQASNKPFPRKSGHSCFFCHRFCCTKQNFKIQHLFQILYSHVTRRKERVLVAFRD